MPTRQITRLALMVCFVGYHFLRALVAPAVAAPPPGTPHDPIREQWFKSLRAPASTVPCCDLSDGARIAQDHVRQLPNRSWQVFLDDAWVDVPPDRVVTSTTSIDGEAYLFLKYNGQIRCFVPPVGMY